MRIATWNVNSLKARTEAVERWLERAQPDVLLMQETKLSDADAPELPFRMAGYELVHHGEGRWNGVAIASRRSAPPTSSPTSATGRSATAAPARRSRSARTTSIRSTRPGWCPRSAAASGSSACTRPNGRVVGSPFYAGKLDWFERLRRWLDETASPDEPLVLGGDLNATPTDDDVWDAVRAHGGTHVSEPEREALASLRDMGPRRRLPNLRARTRRAASRGGITGPACSTATRGCGSTCCT